MAEGAVAVPALLVLGWAIVSGALARHDVTGPFVFAAAGYVLANPDSGGVEPGASGLDGPSVVFIGWFGPRGLVSVVFALLAIEELGEALPEVNRAVATVVLTVALSVLFHGITARPSGRKYVQLEHHQPAGPGPRTRRCTLAAGTDHR